MVSFPLVDSMKRLSISAAALGLSACSSSHAPSPVGGPDTVAIYSTAAALSADSMRGRGPWSPESEKTARWLADRLTALGARPAVGTSLLVPFTAAPHEDIGVHNVVGVLPAKSGSIDGPRIGITAHFDHLGVGEADARGDAIFNGFLDDAIGTAMVLDIAR